MERLEQQCLARQVEAARQKEQGAEVDALGMFIRLGVAALGGLVLGLDRELRGISAGVRTHAIVSVSAAVITVSALLLYAEIRAAGGGEELDPLRVIQGLAQAIGFIAAGAIFVSKADVKGLGDKEETKKDYRSKDLRGPRSDLSTREKFT